jgi:hypothetical protein
MWAMDFVRAARERPLWARILLRLAMGKYAYREFIGMMDSIQRDSGCLYLGYELEHLEYHTDKVPRDWWTERNPEPLKDHVLDKPEVLA